MYSSKITKVELVFDENKFDANVESTETYLGNKGFAHFTWAYLKLSQLNLFFCIHLADCLVDNI